MEKNYCILCTTYNISTQSFWGSHYFHALILAFPLNYVKYSSRERLYHARSFLFQDLGFVSLWTLKTMIWSPDPFYQRSSYILKMEGIETVMQTVQFQFHMSRLLRWCCEEWGILRMWQMSLHGDLPRGLLYFPNHCRLSYLMVTSEVRFVLWSEPRVRDWFLVFLQVQKEFFRSFI